jgi:hypothetical protein
MNTTKLTLKLYWQHARRYPHMVAGVLISVPLTILAGSFLPPLIVANVLNRLSRHDYDPRHLWASFGVELVAYGALQISSGIIGWRAADIFAWRMEGKVERDIAPSASLSTCLSKAPGSMPTASAGRWSRRPTS